MALPSLTSAVVMMLVLSQQPQKKPGVWHVLVDVASGQSGCSHVVVAGSDESWSSVVVVVDVVSSQQPQKCPGVLQMDEEMVEMPMVVVLSLQPNHPGVLQVDVDVVVVVGSVVVVVVVLSQQPNQPGVLHVDVEVDVVVETEVGPVVVVSKHPHQPGVSHVSVRVRVRVEVVDVCPDVVVVSVSLDSYIFH